MGKVENIENYIRQCDENKDENEKEKLLMQIIHTYSDEIRNITDGLDMYSNSFEGHKINYTEDAKLIKAKLINYKDNLEREDKKQQFELEKLRLQQSAFQINNTATNTNDNTSIVNNSVTFNLGQTIENIHSLPEPFYLNPIRKY